MADASFPRHRHRRARRPPADRLRRGADRAAQGGARSPTPSASCAFRRPRSSAAIRRSARKLKLDHCRANGIGSCAASPAAAPSISTRARSAGSSCSRASACRCRRSATTRARSARRSRTGSSTAFAIDARFRPRNDIEVGGQKLCGTGGFFDGDTLFYQGTVLIDVDPARMMACLNVPAAKLQEARSRQGRAAA